MGMFDYIKYKADCEVCGAELKDFQSKDGPCDLKELKPKHVDYFYAYCDNCKAYHAFWVKRKCKVKKIKVYVRER